MGYKNLVIEREDQIETIIVNRPQVLNALNSELLDELEEEIDILSGIKDIKVVIVTGAGRKAFIAGADILELKNLSSAQARDFSKRGNKIFKKIESLPQPVIAAIGGFALGGGCELALACDLRIASENAKLGQPEINLGLIPGYGGTQRLARLIGLAKAKELIFTGNLISAETALKIGLVNQVVLQDELMLETKKLAEQLAGKPFTALKSAKEAINKVTELTLSEGLDYEADKFALCCGTYDKNEGISAFLEKRIPVFQGK